MASPLPPGEAIQILINTLRTSLIFIILYFIPESKVFCVIFFIVEKFVCVLLCIGFLGSLIDRVRAWMDWWHRP